MHKINVLLQIQTPSNNNPNIYNQLINRLPFWHKSTWPHTICTFKGWTTKNSELNLLYSTNWSNTLVWVYSGGILKLPTAGNLLAGLWKCHPSERGGQSFCVHLTASSLEVIVLPGLSVWGLKKPTLGWVWHNSPGDRNSLAYIRVQNMRLREGTVRCVESSTDHTSANKGRSWGFLGKQDT